MPISGMTGFGRSEGALDGWTWAVEARSVNGRNLETRFRGPPGFDGLERRTRESAQARFHRGNIAVGLQAKRAEGAATVRINHEQIERYLVAGAPYVSDGRARPPRLDGLLALRGVIETEDSGLAPEAVAELEAAMGASINSALDALLLSRRDEGKSLQPILGGQVRHIGDLTFQAGDVAAGQPAALKARYEARLKELAADAAMPERILQEAAALAIRADVREELDRLAGHVASAREHLASDGAVGRKLDFLTQEFMREANTLCSKSTLPALTALGLDLKATIEQFREQVQNVE